MPNNITDGDINRMIREAPQRIVNFEDDSRLNDLTDMLHTVAESRSAKYAEIEKQKLDGAYMRLRNALDKVPWNPDEGSY